MVSHPGRDDAAGASKAGGDDAAQPRPPTAEARALDRDIDDLLAQAQGVPEQWDAQRFRYVSWIQEAARNCGRVDLCEDLQMHDMVAVKAMPISWVCENHRAFVEAHPEENELPWRDIGATRYFSCQVGLDSVCNFRGLFRRPSEEHGQEICLVLSYCAGGDLFSWLERGLPTLGPARETAARPLMRKVLEAVREVHAHGVAHGDLSLENVLLAREEMDPEKADVRLIDFGACTGARASGVHGKPSYQAPEVHSEQEYDALAADVFSLGVMLFTLVVGNYPWRSTRPHVCPCFSFAAERGLPAYLARRKIRQGSGGGAAAPAESGGSGQIVTLATLLSPDLVALLSVLLSVRPQARPSVAAIMEHRWFAAGGGEAEPPPPPAAAAAWDANGA